MEGPPQNDSSDRNYGRAGTGDPAIEQAADTKSVRRKLVGVGSRLNKMNTECRPQKVADTQEVAPKDRPAQHGLVSQLKGRLARPVRDWRSRRL